MNSHYLFNSGNYYVDLTNVSSAEQCKKFLKDQNVEYNVQDTLLILDHVDQIWKKHGAQFRWWVIDVANRFGVTILLISRESITEQLQDSNVIEVKGIEIGPINEYESADLLIALTKRVITLNEIHCDSTSMTLHSALEFEPNLRNCSGVPQYIRILADLLEYNTFDTINIKKEIPTWVRQEMKRQKVALENSYSDQHEHQRHKMQKSKISSFKNSSQSSFHNDKKENKRNRKKRERKEKKMESKISGSPSYISKNEKRRLRVIQEEKEDSNKHVNSPHKKEEYLKEGDYYFDDDADQQYNISLSMPKKHNSQKSNEARKNESFIVENKNAIDPKMKKNLSFKIDSLNNDYENNPITPLKTKKSKGKSKNKSRDSKKTNTKKKDSFIPLRDSQVDEFLFFAPTTQYNKDDFNIKEPSKQDFNLDQPMMKKKGVSFNASINKREPLESNDVTLRCKTAGISLPNKTLRLGTECSDIIHERRSEYMRSSLDGSDDEIDKFIHPSMNTLFVPQVDEQMIRKRVKSFKQKSNDTPSDEAKMEDNKDPYLMDSEDDEDDDEINQFITKRSSKNQERNNLDNLLDTPKSNNSRRIMKYGPVREEDEEKEYSPNKFNQSKSNRLMVKPLQQISDTHKSFRIKEKLPFFCDEASIDVGNMSDDMGQESLIDPLEEYQPNFKKSAVNISKNSDEKHKINKKTSKTGKNTKKFQHKTKNKYNPHGRKTGGKKKGNKNNEDSD